MAKYTLTGMFTMGFLIKKDHEKTKAYLVAAADKNHVDAQFEVGKLHNLNASVAPDSLKRALIYFTWAAKNGHKGAEKERRIIEKMLSPKRRR